MIDGRIFVQGLTITDRMSIAKAMAEASPSRTHSDHLYVYSMLLNKVIRTTGDGCGCACHNPCDKWDWFGDYIEYKMLHPESKATYGQYRLSMANTPIGDKCRAGKRSKGHG